MRRTEKSSTGVGWRPRSALAYGQTKQDPIFGSGQGPVEPTAKLLMVDFSVFHFGQYDSADQYLPAGRGLAFAQRTDGTLARIEALLTKLQLGEFLL